MKYASKLFVVFCLLAGLCGTIVSCAPTKKASEETATTTVEEEEATPAAEEAAAPAAEEAGTAATEAATATAAK